MLVLQRRLTASDAVAFVRVDSHIQAVKLAPAHHVSDFPVPRASVPNAHADHGRQRHIRSLGTHLLLPTSLAYLLLAISNDVMWCMCDAGDAIVRQDVSGHVWILHSIILDSRASRNWGNALAVTVYSRGND